MFSTVETRIPELDSRNPVGFFCTRMPVGIHPPSSDSPQTPLAMRSCFVQSLESHSWACSIIPCSLWIVYLKSYFWKTYQRLYWAVRDKESMSHSYSWVKDLQKLKVTDSILSCREVSLEESQQAEWCKIKPPGILWISHIVLYSYFFY